MMRKSRWLNEACIKAIAEGNNEGREAIHMLFRPRICLYSACFFEKLSDVELRDDRVLYLGEKILGREHSGCYCDC